MLNRRQPKLNTPAVLFVLIVVASYTALRIAKVSIPHELETLFFIAIVVIAHVLQPVKNGSTGDYMRSLFPSAKKDAMNGSGSFKIPPPDKLPPPDSNSDGE